MSALRPIQFLAFFALGAVTYVAYATLAPSNFNSAPDTVSAAAAPAQAVATPVAATVEPGATSAPVATVQPAPTSPPVAATPPTLTAEPVATTAPVAAPNRGPSHVGPIPPIMNTPATPAAPPAEPQPAASSAPAFASIDATLYARRNARLRAAPSTTADVLKKLAADAPLHAVARSADGAWWQVSLAGGGAGYVNRAAVSKERIAKAKPAAAASTTVAAGPQPAQRSQGMLVYVDQAVSWINDAASHGSAADAKRTEH